MEIDILNRDYKDDDPDVWNLVYNKAYQNKIIGSNFDLMKPAKNRDGRYAAGNFRDPGITISGETDFNFSDSGYVVRGKTKYQYYLEILDQIEDEDARQKCIDLLTYCCRMTTKVGNFSLMQTTGSLNNLKGIFTSTDRIDTFIYALNNYYLGIDEMILFRCSAASIVDKLRKYLDLFRDPRSAENSIYTYCEEVYHISSHELVDELIESGKRAIVTPNQLLDFMILAIRFWTAKSQYYQQVGVSDKWKLLIVRKEEYLVEADGLRNAGQL